MMKKLKLVIIGFALILAGILGAVFVEPPLLTPRHPTNSFWFWHNMRHLIADILVLVGVLGILLLVAGLLAKIPPIRRLLQNIPPHKRKNLLIIIIIGVIGVLAISILALFQSFLEQNQKPPELENLEQLYFSKTDPLAFVEILKKNPKKQFVILSIPNNWIKEEHVAKLMKLIDSKEPASLVISAVSSKIYPPEPSTVGNEAMFLIEGFRKGGYPPALSSKDYPFKSNPDEFREWWDEFKKRGCKFREASDFSIYLAAKKRDVSQMSEIDINNLELQDEPILSINDIVSYKKKTHEIKLTEPAYERIEGINDAVFVVCADRIRIYGGIFRSPLSSIPFDGMVITEPIDPNLWKQRVIIIQYGYPPQEFEGEDPRFDPRILQSLKLSGKLK